MKREVRECDQCGSALDGVRQHYELASVTEGFPNPRIIDLCSRPCITAYVEWWGRKPGLDPNAWELAQIARRSDG